MTVYVVHPIRQDDISAASKWGEFAFVNDGYVYGDELLPDPKGVEPAWIIPPVETMSINRAAHAYRPRLDYILIAGDHLQFALLVALIARRNNEFTVLRFDKKMNDYIPVRMHLGLAHRAADVIGSSNIGDRSNGQDGREGGSKTGRSTHDDSHASEISGERKR